jgi:phage tail sheath protein FI
MPQMVEYTYPGIYLAENANLPRTVTPATTALTVFVGPYQRGPVNRAILVTSWSEFSSIFGGIDGSSLAAYAVAQFFLNGGGGAWIIRVAAEDAAPAKATIWGLDIEAEGPGAWGDAYSVTFTRRSETLVNVEITTTTGSKTTTVELLQNLYAPDTRTLAAAITTGSSYITAPAPDADADVELPADAPDEPVALTGGSDGTWTPDSFSEAVTGQFQTGGPLDHIAPRVFNIMCIPDAVWLYEEGDPVAPPAIYTDAIAYCKTRQAFVLVDPPAPESATPPAWAPGALRLPTVLPPTNPSVGVLQGLAASQGEENGPYGALYYPWLLINDPINVSRPRAVPPSGTIAGIYANTDASRGVWKAPAGTGAVLVGAVKLTDTSINDEVNGQLNVAGINCLRTFPTYGNIVWGSRTLAGADLIGSTFKYVPIRRLADFIEQSVMQSLRWAVFELNAPPLWATISMQVGAFMAGLYAAGAFGGTSAAEAYHVACDASTTSEDDMLRGIVNIVVGFQPVEPAEFVVLTVQIPVAAPGA